MNAESTQCPSCGQPVTGSFCNHCGASLTSQIARKQWNAQTILPWVAICIGTVALVVSVVALLDRGYPAPQPSPFALPLLPLLPLSSTSPAPEQPPDLSTMTPRQAADRLFNEIMAANESGNTEEALRFVSMAIEAYNNLGTLDDDARYHLALIHMVAGDIKSAREQLNKLRRSTAKHLLGFMLEHQIIGKSGNKDSAARVYKAFLAAYESEIVVGRAEYQDHQRSIERFRKAAQASIRGKQQESEST